MLWTFITLLLLSKRGLSLEPSPLRDKASNSVQNLIVDGRITSEKKYPFFTRLLEHDSIHSFCGGSLMTKRFVVTAAHCLTRFEAIKYFVSLGSNDTREGIVTISVSKHFIHPKFTGNHTEYDAALIRLKSDAPDRFLRVPLKLPLPSSNFNGVTGVVMGYGFLQTEGPDSKVLREINVVIEDCNNENNIICARAPGVGGTCFGDSGGPLVVKNDSSYFLVGIASAIHMPCGDASNVDFYTDTGHLKSCFDKIMSYYSGTNARYNVREIKSVAIFISIICITAVPESTSSGEQNPVDYAYYYYQPDYYQDYQDYQNGEKLQDLGSNELTGGSSDPQPVNFGQEGLSSEGPCSDYEPGEDDLQAYDFIRSFQMDVVQGQLEGVSRTRGSNRMQVAYRLETSANLSIPSSAMFPLGVPQQFSLIGTFRIREPLTTPWNLLEISDSTGFVQLAVTLHETNKSVHLLLPDLTGSVQILEYTNMQEVFDGSWHKLHFGVLEREARLYVDCESVAKVQLLPVGSVPIDGAVCVARSNWTPRQTVPIDLQWMVMSCDPTQPERETCTEISVNDLPPATTPATKQPVVTPCECPAIRNGTKGAKGAKGDAGTRGEPGRPGYPGEDGTPGLPGASGRQGAIGVPGESGRPGHKGEKGDTGLIGPRGNPGMAGLPGSVGSPGEPGSPGSDGRPGQDGLPGPQGPPGNGVRLEGDRGARGAPGKPGEQGKPGIPGFPGEKGENGATGTPGRDGNPGNDGTPGLDGVPGERGTPGNPGPPGLPGPPGSAMVVPAQTSSGMMMPGLQGPPGQAGPPGLPGTPGHKGPPGKIGPVGPAGPKGDKGANGSPGDQGEQGVPGVPGIKGHTGAPGERGVDGKTGPMGPEGPAGIPGSPGVQGTPGEIGSPGEKGHRGAEGKSGRRGEPGSTGPAGKSGAIGEPGRDGTPGKPGAPGKEGPQGPPGSLGLQGLRGHPGKPGKVGRPGSDGARGQRGNNGQKGPPGVPGKPGLAGKPGTPGRKGDTGETGNAGTRGNPGLPGKPGPVGAPGVQGIQGLPGLTGPMGPAGPVGLPGPPGDTAFISPQTKSETRVRSRPGLPGSPGSPGERGADGAQGLQGEQGPQGERGPQGYPGTPGQMGKIGLPGPKGSDGIPGRSISESEVRDICAAILREQLEDLTAGLQGPPGPPGRSIRGRRGPSGEQGPVGERGLTGPSGPRGMPGMDGPEGAQGMMGPPGNRGEPGPQGPPGASIEGPMGPQGMLGPPGEPGMGVAGKPGRRGEQGRAGVPGVRGLTGIPGQPGFCEYCEYSQQHRLPQASVKGPAFNS